MKYTKIEMLDWLVSKDFKNWIDVFEFYDSIEQNSKYGWYTEFDGDNIEEMYLTNVHPLGDESGDIISISDFYKCKNYKFQENDHFGGKVYLKETADEVLYKLNSFPEIFDLLEEVSNLVDLSEHKELKIRINNKLKIIEKELENMKV